MAKKKSAKKWDPKTLESIIGRAHYLFNQMIYMANERSDKEKGDPKVGGHCSASASAVHILGALHLIVKSGFDHIANKPHASPADHAFNYLLDLFLHKDLSQLSLEEANQAMQGLRAYPKDGEYVFQSYHSVYDPDHRNFFPSGTVGIPPVQAGYLAHAYRFAKDHGYEVPEAHFWAVIGDSEFREGSLLEAAPDLAERQVGQLTWIIDYNRQSLDGHRITNKEIMKGTDNERIARTLQANGWEVIQVRHGKTRQELFKKEGGEAFKKWLEDDLDDYELQALLLVHDAKELKSYLQNADSTKDFGQLLKDTSAEDLYTAIHDFGGHDLESLVEAMEQSKKSTDQPTVILAHTIKGWGLEMAATPGNHSALVGAEELAKLREKQGLSEDTLFARFSEDTKEGQYLKARGQKLYEDFKEQEAIKERNQKYFDDNLPAHGEIPESLDINLKMASYPHTQWMLGQLTAKMTRIANTPLDEKNLAEKQKPLGEREKPWHLPGQLMVPMAPDVGTSTNLNPAMDGKIFGAYVTEDYEEELHVKDRKTPDLVPGHEESDRYLRFEIAEANSMSCMGSYGRMRDTLGIPVLPLMTVYDFFIKRAHDQYFYDLYWKSSFILVGTPSGVTLSPEGAQHGWKSDFQIPNQITWEPFYCQELDWIFADAVKRHMLNDNEGRTGVLIRGVTRGVDQKQFLKLLKTQVRFKSGLDSNQKLHPKGLEVEGATDESQVISVSEQDILAAIKEEVLQGAYHLIDYKGYAGYEPGDNVVNIFAMGSLGTEAIAASKALLEKGIYANVIMVTSPDLLVGNLAQQDNFTHLTKSLGVDGTLHLQPLSNGAANPGELRTLAGRRIPAVSVHDGEPGLLDNIGSIVGVKHEALAVRKHSRCGRPRDVYEFHGIDSEAIVEACGKVLSETALEKVEVSERVLKEAQNSTLSSSDWRQLWSTKNSNPS